MQAPKVAINLETEALEAEFRVSQIRKTQAAALRKAVQTLLWAEIEALRSDLNELLVDELSEGPIDVETYRAEIDALLGAAQTTLAVENDPQGMSARATGNLVELLRDRILAMRKTRASPLPNVSSIVKALSAIEAQRTALAEATKRKESADFAKEQDSIRRRTFLFLACIFGIVLGLVIASFARG